MDTNYWSAKQNSRLVFSLSELNGLRKIFNACGTVSQKYLNSTDPAFYTGNSSALELEDIDCEDIDRFQQQAQGLLVVINKP
jgi:hypothetical protein